MKKLHVLLFGLFICLLSLNAQTLSQKFYFDFGKHDNINGEATVNPDKNGNYWNNVGTVTVNYSQPNLINSTNSASSLALTVTGSSFDYNGILNGGLLTPYESQLVGNEDLAINTATEDYFFTTLTANGPSIEFSGLNPAKKYKFKIFGSRNSASLRTSQYVFQGAGSPITATLSTSTVAGLGGLVYTKSTYSPSTNTRNQDYSLTNVSPYTVQNTYYGNNSTVYASDYIAPDVNNKIKITLTVVTGGFAYINCLKMEEYSVPQVDATSISISGNDITSSGATSQMSILYTPSNATPQSLNWTVDDTNIATINSSGLLTPKKNGTVTVTASFIQNAQTISATKQLIISNQITELFVSGTATSNGDNPATALQMNATVGITGVVTKGEFEFATTLNASGTLKFYTSRTDVNAPVYGVGATAGTVLSGGTAITSGISGPVLIKVYLATNTYKIFPINPLKISQMGSSVSYGTGATSNHGYAYLFTQVLAQRYLSSLGANWLVSNISVPGNNTIAVLNRWDNDLLNDNSQYVVYALSLGNEGIVGGGQTVFDQFKNNLLLLINKAKSVGKTPIIANCYTRGDYGTSEYNYVKQMNMLIHDWDVPSINLLGAIDDGAGKWPVSPVNYQADVSHPNDAGHAELLYAIVPSLYDALLAGKAQPTKHGTSYIAMGKSVTSDLLKFTPDNTLHSFTTVFDIKTTTSGIISTFSQNTSTGTLRVEPSGVITYFSPTGSTITGVTSVTDGQWHKITLTHYYAWGKTMLYTDNALAGNLTEKLTPSTFVLNDANSPNNISYREWMFYRAGMNADEVSALNSGKMLKSSLELYAPLDGQNVISPNSLINLAQSTNTIQRIEISTGTRNLLDASVSVFPNPVSDCLTLQGMKTSDNITCKIYGIDGKEVLSNIKLIDNQIDVSLLHSGMCFLYLKNNVTHQNQRASFVKR